MPNLVRRVILPMIKGKVEWKGWHAFRHGLATNLLSLRVDLVTVAAILRHSDVRTTLLYPVSTDEATRAAMSKIEDWIKAIDHEGDGEPK